MLSARCGVWMMLMIPALMMSSAPAEQQSPTGGPSCSHPRCKYLGSNVTSDSLDYYYEVEGNNVTINYLYNYHRLTVDCHGASVLESPALPRAEPALRFGFVTLENCPPPATSSLHDTLAALNVSCEPPCDLELTNLPATPPLAAKHFASLEHLKSLYIQSRMSINPERDFLEAITNLETLIMSNVTLPERLPEAVYSSTTLRQLTVEGDGPLDAGAVPPGLRWLILVSSATTLQLDAAPALEALQLHYWVEPLPPPLARCDALTHIYLKAPAMRALPRGWLANCSRLERLAIEGARNLATLPLNLFSKGTPLKHLALTQGALETVPLELFDGLDRLESIILYGNRLRTMSSESSFDFLFLPSLRYMNLSSNYLDGSVLDVLAELWIERFTTLDLSRNPLVGDVCSRNGSSPLHLKRTLGELSLSGTNISRICRDWREEMPLLELLDLSDTRVSELAFEDLQYNRAVQARVLLLGAPVTAVRVTREDYNEAALAPPSFTSVDMDVELHCDCGMYWARRVLEHPRAQLSLASISGLRCVGGGFLRDVPVEELVCGAREECAAAALPAECACTARPDDDPLQNRRLVRVRCENSSLHRVPPLPADPAQLYELQLAHNRIADLHADDLPQNIKGLDLRNNSLALVDEQTAARLAGVRGMLRLAGNPLQCGCSAAPLLRAMSLRARSGTVDAATCYNGTVLTDVSIVACPPPADWSLVACLAGLLAALLALALAASMYLASRERRFFLLAALHRWGVVWRGAEPREDDRRYDAFLTFSHKNEGVVLEMMARLEPTYRLCVHHRDWIPGDYIPGRIEESVRASRRTVALVSKHFLGSTWALAEFRQAHTAAMLEARPRLVVVMLEDPAALREAMDPSLRRYIDNNLYVRWGEPWFWDKLAVLLPRPRAGRPHDPGLPGLVGLPPPSDPGHLHQLDLPPLYDPGFLHQLDLPSLLDPGLPRQVDLPPTHDPGLLHPLDLPPSTEPPIKMSSMSAQYSEPSSTTQELESDANRGT